MNYPKIGIRPVIDGRWGGVRESLEKQTMGMAHSAKELIESNLCYPDGTPVQCVISSTTIGGGAEAAKCAAEFESENVVATLSVTPCWCYGSETFDMNPNTIKAVWGFNGTERPGAVYLAAVMAAYAQKGMPAFSIYGKDVQDMTDTTIPADVAEKILRFAKGSVTVGWMRNKSYVNLGGIAMGIAGSYCNAEMFQKYLGIRAEWVDMSEIIRRITLEIYDHDEYEKAFKWVKDNCKEGFDKNAGKDFPEIIKKSKVVPADKDWEFITKMTLIVRDILLAIPSLMKWAGMKKLLAKTPLQAASKAKETGRIGFPTPISRKLLWLLRLIGTAKRLPLRLQQKTTLLMVLQCFSALLSRIPHLVSMMCAHIGAPKLVKE